MKKIISFFIPVFLFSSIHIIQAQNFSKDDVAALKRERKSLFQQMYAPDSLISKTIDSASRFPWQSQTFKNTESIIDTLHETMQINKSSGYFFMYGYFPEKIQKQDCAFFSGQLLSYDILNEKNKKTQLHTKDITDIGFYGSHGVPIGYLLHLRFMPVTSAKAFTGFVEYEITAPTSFKSLAIEKADTGKRIVLNKHTYLISAFTKNYLVLASDTPLKEINFDFIGTDENDKKYQEKYTQGKGYKTALDRSVFLVSVEMYNYYITHPDLSDKELNTYLNDYFKRHKNSLDEEAQILIIQDIGYIEKMFCYWPTSFATKRFMQTIDLK